MRHAHLGRHVPELRHQGLSDMGLRVWLAGNGQEPADHPPVRDDQARVWHPEHGQYHTSDNRHHANWAQLSARTDLVEVSR